MLSGDEIYGDEITSGPASDDEVTTLRTGDRALLLYPAGDIDEVEILALSRWETTVRLPDGREYRTVPEDLGIGVDDSIVAEHDPEPSLEDELARQAESDRLVEEFVAEGDRDPDSVARKVVEELGRRSLADLDDYPATDARPILEELDRGTGPDRYPPLLRDANGRVVDVG